MYSIKKKKHNTNVHYCKGYLFGQQERSDRSPALYATGPRT